MEFFNMNTRSRNQIWTPLKALALPIALVAAFRPYGSADAANELREAASKLPAGKMLTLGSINRVDGLTIDEADDGTTTLLLRGTRRNRGPAGRRPMMEDGAGMALLHHWQE